MTMDLSGKKVLVIGAGISGFAAAKLAKRFGAQVVLSDAKREQDIKYDFAELRAGGAHRDRMVRHRGPPIGRDSRVSS